LSQDRRAAGHPDHLVPLMRCGECHYWEPLDVMSSIGECKGRDSPYYRKPIFRTNPSPSCFKARDLHKAEFLWCEKCKETVAEQALEKHAGHQLFIGTAQFPVEENLEVTHSGD